VKNIILPTCSFGYFRQFTRKVALTISIVGLLALSASAFGTRAIAGQEEDLRASLSELLFKAVTVNDINAVRTVVEAGADLSRANLNGQTALDIAVDRSHFDIAQYLVFARRIEQQTTAKSTPAVGTVQQTSPEAAPIVDVTRAAPLPPVIPVTEPTIVEPEVVKTANEPTYDQLMNAAKRLAAAAEAMANKSAPEPIVTTRKLAKAPTATSAPKPVEVAKVVPKVAPRLAAPVFIIGPNGKLIQATAAQIQRAQKASNLEVASLLPDVEPRKSFFIPRPRLKPENIPQRLARPSTPQPSRQAALPTSRIPKTSTPRIEVPAFAKSSIPRVSEGAAPQSVRIRPTRRISPQLLDKLRRRLRTSNKRKQSVSEAIVPTSSKLVDAPKVIPPNLSRAVDIAPLPPIKTDPKHVSDVQPTLKQTPKAQTVAKSETGAVQKLLNGLGNLFGLQDETPKTEQVAKLEFNEEKAETEITPVPQPSRLLPVQQVPAKTKVLELPQNASAGFETRDVSAATPIAAVKEKIKARIKTRPVEVAVATPSQQPSPRIQLPTAPAVKTPTPKAKAPGMLDSFKEVLLPGATVNPRIDRSISDTANEKIEEASLRRLTRAMPLSRLRKPLKNVLLTLGDSVTTGQTKLPRGIAEPDACVRKRRGEISFCVVPVDWPRAIEPAFSVNTSLYQGTRAIARYDKGKAVHYHALYDTADHDKIIDFMKKRYGPPTDIWKRMIAPFGKPRQPNPTYVWRSHDSETDQVTILEVRKFDDSRAVFPDELHGAIRLYPAGGPPVFPIITAHDIMSIDWAARSDHIDGASPALARTIRVRP
jgi:hypothetical protein